MRFAQLTLERYGRFEDCTLNFRTGAPDLHVVFGANEAGKSTTLSAVSDLLFGFEPRSPFNFRFDYPLLRVGAVLEDDEGRAFACRRRKASSKTLVDAQDRPIEEGPLLAMLRGQNRERFRLGFSLDQTRLRQGGRDMVEARDDLGQALFAAGSGMTGVTAALAALESEADAIWGRRAAARRLYTTAERELEDALRRSRDLQLKPKAWTDANTVLATRTEELSTLRRRQVELTAEHRRVERLRRIGPDMRRRTEMLVDLAADTGVPTLSAQAQGSAEAALTALEAAERATVTAEELLGELDAQAAALTPDDAALAALPVGEALAERRGAVQKAAVDLLRLRGELDEVRRREAALRVEVGAGAPAASRLTIGRLRELAGSHKEARSALVALEASTADAERLAAPLRSALADAPLNEGLRELVAAVDAARALGADIDARCAAQAAACERLASEARSALHRLAPWAGEADALAALPPVDGEEIADAQAAAARASDEAEAAVAETRSAQERMELLALKRRGLAEGGQAVPAERIAAVRSARDAAWLPLRAYLAGDGPLAEAPARAREFEEAVGEADAAADQRFALAEASGQVAALDAQAAELALARAQAEARTEQALARGRVLAGAWSDRLTQAGLPSLAPERLRGWLEARENALRARLAAQTARAALDADLSRRADAARRLHAHLAPAATPTEGALGGLLEAAERLRAEGEGRAQAFTTDRSELRALEAQLARLSRQTAEAQTRRDAALADWERERAALGLSLPIDAADVWLQALDELRGLAETATGLAARVDGIERDAATFAADVGRLADDLGQPGEIDPSRRLDALRARVATARSAADTRAGIEAGRRTRLDAVYAARAARDAALTSLAPRLAELRLVDLAALPGALEASSRVRARREALAEVERRILSAGDGYALDALATGFAAEDPDALSDRLQVLDSDLEALAERVAEAADAVGAARLAAEALSTGPGAQDAAADAAAARAEMDAQAESYVLKRAEAVTLRWAVDRYREQRQNPLLARASALFASLTLGRYRELKIDYDAAAPRLLALCQDGESLVGVDAMSEGTSDQLFLALRLAAVEQALAAGVRLPFLADDLFVNFDDARAAAGLRVLADLARSTQVLIFTHHVHISDLARKTVDADTLSECRLS